ncbi:MAG: class IV adenylate cyclase [archaeon]
MPLDREVEIKIPVSHNEFYSVREMIKNSKTASFIDKSTQIDHYYVPAHRNFVGVKYPFEWLRVGVRGGKTIVNYKHFYPENEEKFTHCDEFSTEIENGEQLTKIMLALNFKKIVTVEKTREAYLYDNIFEVALDKVKDLGFFVEIEAKKDLGGVWATRYEISALACKFMLNPSKADLRGYPYLMMAQQGLIKRD